MDAFIAATTQNLRRIAALITKPYRYFKFIVFILLLSPIANIWYLSRRTRLIKKLSSEQDIFEA